MEWSTPLRAVCTRWCVAAGFFLRLTELMFSFCFVKDCAARSVWLDAVLQDAVTARYIKLWAAATTPEEVFPTSNSISAMITDVTRSVLDVSEEHAQEVVMTVFRFPMKSNPNRFSVETCINYMKRNLSVWNFKKKSKLFADYIERLVQDTQYGRRVGQGRSASVELRPVEALQLITDNSFITSTSSFNALVAAIRAFVASEPATAALWVPRSSSVAEPFLCLLNAQFAWFTCKVGLCVLTCECGLLRVSAFGFQLWLMLCANTHCLPAG